MIIKRKEKTDLRIQVNNLLHTSYINVDIWKECYNEKDIITVFEPAKKQLQNPFILGFLRIYCSNLYFFENSSIKLGGKMYHLRNYIKEGGYSEVLIYNFSQGWLAPLNVHMNMNEPLLFNIPASTSVTFMFSIV